MQLKLQLTRLLLQLLQKRAQALLSCAVESLSSATADHVSVNFFAFASLASQPLLMCCIPCAFTGCSVQGIHRPAHAGDIRQLRFVSTLYTNNAALTSSRLSDFLQLSARILAL